MPTYIFKGTDQESDELTNALFLGKYGFDRIDTRRVKGRGQKEFKFAIWPMPNVAIIDQYNLEETDNITFPEHMLT